ncbi:uncharacterized protein TA10755 [Theileria annulata]|uniref:OTU domain-containing protein n=1 Tax=Theileria annulata TaxID=5874 RepID=Q4U947_THEAN|nr:uncharacterized protein TA10755 [Theileria annulata]CAI76656.1 hypothetical protein, conserved [Theileria annulata]|eukprot:XP_953281.1 hypothetical protein, conserved [Theileria annulata]
MNSSTYLYILILVKIFIPQIHAINPFGVNPTPLSTIFPHRTDLPRRLLTALKSYDHSDNTSSSHICSKFPGWTHTTLAWEDKLAPYRLTLCSKEFGGGGNCMFYSIAGALKEAGYKISFFNFDREDMPLHVRQSILKMNLNKEKFLTMPEVRILASIAFVGLDPTIPGAESYLDVEELKTKLKNTSVALGDAADIQWNPKHWLQMLESKAMDPLQVAKTVFKQISSFAPVYTWGSGDDLYGLAEIMNVDFILFHKTNQVIQHVRSSARAPVCTLLLYYHTMIHFQCAGIVEWVFNSLQYKLFTVYNKFEISDRLYDLIFNQQHFLLTISIGESKYMIPSSFVTVEYSSIQNYDIKKLTDHAIKGIQLRMLSSLEESDKNNE